jgi:hypothetical protein
MERKSIAGLLALLKKDSSSDDSVLFLFEKVQEKIYGGLLMMNEFCSNMTCDSGSNGGCTNTVCRTGNQGSSNTMCADSFCWSQ